MTSTIIEINKNIYKNVKRSKSFILSTQKTLQLHIERCKTFLPMRFFIQQMLKFIIVSHTQQKTPFMRYTSVFNSNTQYLCNVFFIITPIFANLIQLFCQIMTLSVGSHYLLFHPNFHFIQIDSLIIEISVHCLFNI